MSSIVGGCKHQVKRKRNKELCHQNMSKEHAEALCLTLEVSHEEICKSTNETKILNTFDLQKDSSNNPHLDTMDLCSPITSLLCKSQN